MRLIEKLKITGVAQEILKKLSYFEVYIPFRRAGSRENAYSLGRTGASYGGGSLSSLSTYRV